MSTIPAIQQFITHQRKDWVMSLAILHDDLIKSINIGKSKTQLLEIQSTMIRFEVLIHYLDNGRFDLIPFWQKDFRQYCDALGLVSI